MAEVERVYEGDLLLATTSSDAPKTARRVKRGEPQDTTVLIGPMTTGTIAGGPNRGEVEAALSYLAGLAPTRSEGETIIGADESAA